MSEQKQEIIGRSEAQKLYESIFRLSPEAIVLTTEAEGLYLAVNDAYERLIGYRADEVIGHTIDEFSIWHSNTDRQMAIRQVHESGSVNNLEGCFLRKSGEKFYALLSMTKVIVDGKNCYISILMDISDRKKAETELRESEYRFNTLLQNIPSVAVQAYNMEGTTQYWNDASEKLYGYTAQEAVGRNLIDLIVPDEMKSGVKQAISRMSATGQPTPPSELLLIRKDRTRIPVFSSHAIVNSPGHNPELFCFDIDLSELKQSEAALRESEERYRFIAENTADVIWTMSLSTGRYTYVSPSVQKQIGYTPEEILGKEGFETLTPESAVNAARLLEQRLIDFKSGDTSVIALTNLLDQVHKDGHVISIEVSTTLVIDTQGQPVELIGITRDITERKRAETELQESQALTKAIVDSTTDMIWSVDPLHYGLLTFNPSLKEYYKNKRGISIAAGMRPVDLYPTDDYIKTWYEFYKRALSKGSFTTEYVVYSKTDVLQVTFNLLKRNGKVFGISVFGKIVTEQKKAQDELAKSTEQYRQLFNQMKNSIMICEVIFDEAGKPYDHRFLNVNPAFEKLTGISIENAIGKTSKEMMLQAPTEILQQLYNVAMTGEPIEYDYINPALGRHLESRAFSPKYGQFAVVTVDITERKLRETELQTLVSLGTALRSASSRAEIISCLVEQLTCLLNCDAFTVEIVDPIAKEYVYEAASGVWASRIGHRQPVDTGFNADICKTQQPFYCSCNSDKAKAAYPDSFAQGITACAGAPLIAQDQLIGFVWMGRIKEIAESDVRLLAAVADIAANALHRATLYEHIQKDAAELAHSYDTTLEGWVNALEMRDQETEGHSRRVVEMTVELARELGVTTPELEHIRRGALLHDIGKMAVPDSVLLKPGTLNECEWEIMQRHPQYAYHLLEPIEYLRPVLDILHYHHEKWDGSGYPHRLRGESIPLYARIFSIVDVWDALRSDRPYSKAWPKEKALNYIEEQSGLHFDPVVVRSFLKMLEKNLS